MSVPELNSLYAEEALTPRMAYRLWVLSSVHATQSTPALRRLLPHIASIFYGESEKFYEEIRQSLLGLRGRIERGTRPERLSTTTADDVCLHVLFTEIEERLISSAEEVVAGEGEYREVLDPISDFIAARGACLFDEGIARLWEVGGEVLFLDGWFFDNGVPHWDPSRWFEDRIG